MRLLIDINYSLLEERGWSPDFDGLIACYNKNFRKSWLSKKAIFPFEYFDNGPKTLAQPSD